MALLICSLLMGLQSVPGIIKPYSKGVVQFLTKVPEKQKSKDSTPRHSGPRRRPAATAWPSDAASSTRGSRPTPSTSESHRVACAVRSGCAAPGGARGVR